MIELIASIVVAVSTVLGVPVMHTPALPLCAEEDGNRNGQPCTWIDPDTGVGYPVDSVNYR